ncbi:MAG: hypothetical protein HN368_03110 [Spirochaetales bacterium]|jgi:hypothetical protein|nr:hypothetical protein [Spirochaetales bacterium]
MSGKSNTPTDRSNPEASQVDEVVEGGTDVMEVYEKVWLEHIVNKWPDAWGDDLQILIYGDFKPPDKDINIESLGILISSTNMEKTVVRDARCVLKAKVKLSEISVDALEDAIKRVNIFVGARTLVTFGNSPCRWWSHVIHGSGSGIGIVDSFFTDESIESTISEVLKLRDDIRKKVNAALYWIRVPGNLLMDAHREDLLRSYASYWNAFECLVDVICLLKPQEKLLKAEKHAQITTFINERKGVLTPADIQKCYTEIVNPGFVGKAKHAIRTCFSETVASNYIDDCFDHENEDKRLYNIRNAINHGEIDGENLHSRMRVNSRLNVLRMIIWGIFGSIVRFPVHASLK